MHKPLLPTRENHWSKKTKFSFSQYLKSRGPYHQSAQEKSFLTLSFAKILVANQTVKIDIEVYCFCFIFIGAFYKKPNNFIESE